MPTLHAFDALAKPWPPAALTVLAGDDGFLAGLVLDRLRAGAEADVTALDGKTARLGELDDLLSSSSLFDAGRPTVVIQGADDFVSANRAALEARAQAAHAAGRLVLVVTSWPANTRLAKFVEEKQLAIVCAVPVVKRGKSSAPDIDRIAAWLTARAKSVHGVNLPAEAALALIDLHGADLGLLEQQVAKLAVVATAGETLTPDRVAALPGSWRTRTVWEIMDAAAVGRTSDALRPLAIALDAKESPQGLFAQMAFVLRRIGNAVRVFEDAQRQGRRMSLRDALIAAGVPHWNREQLDVAEAQLRRIGRDQARQFAAKTLELDLGLKGSHSRDERARLCLERLLVELAGPPARPTPAGGPPRPLRPDP